MVHRDAWIDVCAERHSDPQELGQNMAKAPDHEARRYTPEWDYDAGVRTSASEDHTMLTCDSSLDHVCMNMASGYDARATVHIIHESKKMFSGSEHCNVATSFGRGRKSLYRLTYGESCHNLTSNVLDSLQDIFVGLRYCLFGE